MARRLVPLALLAALALPAAARGAPEPERGFHAHLDRQVAAGTLDETTARVYAVVAGLRPELLPAPLAAAARAEAGRRACVTGALVELARDWDRLPAELRSLVTRALGHEPPPAAAAAPGAWSRCGDDTPGSHATDHFVIRWGSNDQSVNTAGVEDLADSLEEARVVFLDLGYLEPAGIGVETSDGPWKLPVYLGNTGGEVPTIGWSGGYTTSCPDNWGAAYIVLSNDMEDGGAMGWEVAAHELYHAVQFAYNNYSLAGWWWEASATWAEDVAWPDSNGFTWFSEYQNAPWVTIEKQNGSHEYSMYVLPTALEETETDGIHLMREIWEDPVSNSVQQAMEPLLEPRGTTFVEAFARFTGVAADMNVDDHQVIPKPTMSDRFSTYPAEYVAEVDLPDRWGTNYFDLDPDGSEVDAGRTKVVVQLDGGGDPSWVLALSRIRKDESALVETAVADEEGMATLDGIDFGTLYQQAFVAVSYTEGSGDGSFTLGVEVVEQTEDPGSDDPTLSGDDDDDDGSKDDDAEGGGGGCGGSSPFAWGSSEDPNGGCSSAPGSPGPAPLLCFLAAAAVVRRRHGPRPGR